MNTNRHESKPGSTWLPEPHRTAGRGYTEALSNLASRTAAEARGLALRFRTRLHSLSMRSRSGLWLTILAILVPGLPLGAFGDAFTARWIGATDGQWNDAGNWDIGRVPHNTFTDTYDVVWTSQAVTVTLTQDVVIRNFTFASGGRLRGQSSQTKLTIEGSFVWNQGVLAIRNTTTVHGTATIAGVGANFRTLEAGRLVLKGRTGLHSGLHCVDGAWVSNDLGAVFEAHDGARFSSGGNLATQVVNTGVFRVRPGTEVFTSLQFQNHGLLVVTDRTVEFVAGGRLEQRAGTLRLDGGNIHGSLSLQAGALEGSGTIGSAIVLGRMSGRLDIEHFTPGVAATSAFVIKGRAAGQFDRFSFQNTVSLGGKLEVALTGFLTLPTDVFEIISAPGGILGQFNNVNFGERVTVSVGGGTGSCVVHLASDSKSIVLRDFQDSFSPHPPSPPPRDDCLGSRSCRDCLTCWVMTAFGSSDPCLQLNQRSNGANRHGSGISPTASTTVPLSLGAFYTLQSLMKETTEGRRLVDLYWRHTVEVLTLMLVNPELLDRTGSVFAKFQPGIVALLAGRGADFKITQPMIDELNAVWTAVANLASPALKAALRQEHENYGRFQAFVNHDFTRWADLLSLPTPTQPHIHISSAIRTGSRFSVEINDVSGVDFSLWRSSDLSVWQLVPSVEVFRDGFTLRLTDPAVTPGGAFYQIRF